MLLGMIQVTMIITTDCIISDSRNGDTGLLYL